MTQILLDAAADAQGGTSALAECLYTDLHRMATKLMRSERAGHTLQPTALVGEAYLRLVDQSRAGWQHRAHFLGVAARVMRQVLVDHARARAAEKRGSGAHHVTLGTAQGAAEDTTFELLMLDDLLDRLAALDPRAARVVELRIFGGLTVKEIADALEVSARTVDGDWAMARLWLAREYSHVAPDSKSDRSTPDASSRP